MVKTSHEYAADYSRSPSPTPSVEIPAECAGWRLDAALAKLFPEHSRSRLQGWLKAGLIRLDGGEAEPKRKVYGGERVDFDPGAAVPPAPTLAGAAEDIALKVVFEDEQLIVIDKPAGLVVHRCCTTRRNWPAYRAPASCIGWTRTPAACWWWRRR
jgi:23S rRNA pseudouridine1911/1915/1917 synthase